MVNILPDDAQNTDTRSPSGWATITAALQKSTETEICDS